MAAGDGAAASNSAPASGGATASATSSANGIPAAKDWTPFIELANKSACSNIRNRVFVIDQKVVVLDRQGNCPDASYAQVLYGDTTADVLCSNQDTIGGPRKSCSVQAYAEMFDIMIANLNAPDLGLGSLFRVERMK
jgi:hypothetical protein